jgi:aspartyl-tRNA(Asn)/glutamyl-tRNA(Gln) amidotransferase subunit C
VEPSEIQRIAHLARIEINDNVASETAKSISEVLALVDQLQAVDTEGVTPMAHPLDAVQRLRPDQVTESDVRDSMQNIAPAHEDGLYLVPKVID